MLSKNIYCYFHVFSSKKVKKQQITKLLLLILYIKNNVNKKKYLCFLNFDLRQTNRKK